MLTEDEIEARRAQYHDPNGPWAKAGPYQQGKAIAAFEKRIADARLLGDMPTAPEPQDPRQVRLAQEFPLGGAAPIPEAKLEMLAKHEAELDRYSPAALDHIIKQVERDIEPGLGRAPDGRLVKLDGRARVNALIADAEPYLASLPYEKRAQAERRLRADNRLLTYHATRGRNQVRFEARRKELGLP